MNFRLYIFFLLCLLSVNLLAQRNAETEDEKKLLKFVSGNKTEWAKESIDKGVDLNIVDRLGNSLLMLAAENNNRELVKVFLRKGLDPNYERFFDGFKAIDCAVVSADTPMVELLLSSGANLDINNKETNGVLARAWRSGDERMVRYLLAKGAQISHRTGQQLLIDKILSSVKTTSRKNSISIDEKSFKLIKFLDEYGIPIDDDALMSSGLISDVKGKQNVLVYMKGYRVELEILDQAATRERERERKLEQAMQSITIGDWTDDSQEAPKSIDLNEIDSEAKVESIFKFWMMMILTLVSVPVLVYLIVSFKNRKQGKSSNRRNPQPQPNSKPTPVTKPNKPASKRKSRQNVVPPTNILNNRPNNKNGMNNSGNKGRSRGRTR